jgi:hypothetical protein
MIILAGIVPLTVGIVAHLVWRNGHITGAKAERWAASRGLTLTAENRVTVVDYLHDAGLLRGLGLLAGIVLPQVWSWALGLQQSVVPPWTCAYLGYLVGALYAEISLRRPRGTRASATPRRLHDYLRPVLRRGQVVLGIALVAASAGALMAPWRTENFGGSVVPVVVAAAVGLIGTPIVIGVEGWLVRRPQPVLSPAQLAADDAIRSQSVQSVAASWLAMQLGFLSVPLSALGTTGLTGFGSMTLAGIACVWLGVLVCFNFGQLGWLVRRPLPTSAAEAASC